MFDQKRGTNSPSPTQQEISAPAAFGLLIFVVALLGYAKIQKIDADAVYFRHYETIHLVAYGLVAVGCIALMVGIMWYTRNLRRRTKLLFPISGRSAGVLAGISSDGLKLHVPTKIRQGHVQIVGATGRGKTESVILPWLVRDLARGHSGILLDGKGDPELSSRINDAASYLKPTPSVKVFDLSDPKKSCRINPLSHGTPQQITDRIFTAFNFKEEFYRAVQFQVCEMIVSLIQSTADGKPGAVTMKRVHELLTDDNALADLSAETNVDSLKIRVAQYLAESPETREKNIKGLVSQLAPFAVGEVAELVNGNGSDPSQWMSISELVLSGGKSANEVQIFLVSTLLYLEIGHQLGKLLLQELAWAVGQRSTDGTADKSFLPIFLDEFASFVYPNFVNILNKARSSGVALHLSHQSLGDLRLVSADFATVVNTNTNVKCLLGLNDPETADFFARHLGTHKDEKRTERAQKKPLFGSAHYTGEMSVREVEAYKVHPNQLKNFTQGEGVLHMPTPIGSVTEVIQFSPLGESDFPT